MRTVEVGWQVYRDRCVPPSLNPAARRELRAAFYAGAGYVVDELVDMQVGLTLAETYANHLARWSAEILRHAARAAREDDQI